jgi:hypothetical protein
MASDNESSNAITVFGKLDPLRTGGEAEPLTIDLTAIEARIDPAADAASDAEAPPPPSQAWRDRLGALAASLVAAVLVGAFAGGVATFEIARHAMPSEPSAALADETEKLKQQVARLTGELTAFKAGAESADQMTTQQLAKIGQRLDRAEKAQAEPVARIARIAETVDRLERRAAADVTGSVTTIEKQPAKPPEVEGWTLREYYAGRALVESRSGRLYDVRRGSTLPGVGKIESIKHGDGKVVITTPKGVITTSLEPPRRPFYRLPY